MFYGVQIKAGTTVSPSIDDGGEVLHLSQICLFEPKDDSKTYVQINDGTSTYCVAVLQKDKCEQISVDLFVSTTRGIKISTKGSKNEVHIAGYFEPEGEDGDAEFEDDEESDIDNLANHAKVEDLDEDEDDDDEAVDTNDDEDDDEEENEEIDEDDDEEEEADDNDASDASDESMQAPILTNGVSHTGKGKKISKPIKNSPVSQNKQGEKRKLEIKKTDSKKQKTDKKADSGDTESFKAELTKYLNANGRTSLGILGQKVRKPAAIEKLGQYIKDSPSFKLENGFVSIEN